MADIDLYYKGKVRKKPSTGKRGPPIRQEPRDPDKLKKIVYLRDIDKLSWQQIANRLGGTWQNVYYLYNRWHGHQHPS
jgi:hypothetical protein